MIDLTIIAHNYFFSFFKGCYFLLILDLSIIQFHYVHMKQLNDFAILLVLVVSVVLSDMHICMFHAHACCDAIPTFFALLYFKFNFAFLYFPFDSLLQNFFSFSKQ